MPLSPACFFIDPFPLPLLRFPGILMRWTRASPLVVAGSEGNDPSPLLGRGFPFSFSDRCGLTRIRGFFFSYSSYVALYFFFKMRQSPLVSRGKPSLGVVSFPNYLKGKSAPPYPFEALWILDRRIVMPPNSFKGFFAWRLSVFRLDRREGYSIGVIFSCLRSY